MKKKNKIILLLSLCLAMFFAFSAVAAAENIRVYLGSASSSQTIYISSGSYTVRGGTLGTDSFTAQQGDSVTISRSGGMLQASLNGTAKFSGTGNIGFYANSSNLSLLKYDNVRYRGNLMIYTNGYIVNTVDMEQYLYAVVGQEIGYSAPFEAIAAQAVAARSYAKFYMGGTYYDVKGDTSGQVYGGYDAEVSANNSQIVAAVDKTAHQVMYYDGQLVNAVYHSHAGGYTEGNENIWGTEPVAYLRGVESPYDSYGSYYNSWTVTYTKAELAEKAQDYMDRINQSGSFGDFIELQIYTTDYSGSSDTVSGRVTKAVLVGTGATVSASRDSIRTMLGLRSTKFTVSGNDNSGATSKVYVMNNVGTKVEAEPKSLFAIGIDKIAKALSSYDSITVISASGKSTLGAASSSGDIITITGRGYGHGVGMSQYGAMGMANAGYGYKDILRHYYGGYDPDLLEFRIVE